MSRRFLCMVALVLVLSLGTAACGEPVDEPVNVTDPQPEMPSDGDPGTDDVSAETSEEESANDAETAE